jgi:hypothetical protein
MRRLIRLGNRLVDPQSPQLAAFLVALRLFVEAFEFAPSGYRVIQIARPSIVSYGLYGASGPDAPSLRLQQLVIARGRLATQLDCFLPCQCSASQTRCQIILDKLLYDIDRAIDALSLGTNPDGVGDAETRAFAYGLIIETFLLNNDANDNIRTAIMNGQALVQTTVNNDRPPFGSPEDIYLRNLQTDLNNLLAAYTSQQTNPYFGCVAPNPSLTAAAAQAIQGALLDAYRAVFLPSIGTPPAQMPTIPTLIPPARPPTNSAFPPSQLGNAILQELCMQEDAESQWNSLLQTMAPSCFPEAQLLNSTTLLVQLTRGIRTLPACGPVDVTIPADVATSLAGFVYRENSQGGRGP